MTILRKWGVIYFFALFAISFLNTAKAKAQIGDRVSFQTFYNELEPYGRWVNDPEYGYVWLPDEGADFQPYVSRGHWVITEFGNTWVSDYPWGWAPFHYGRWDFNDYYGWFWVPGSEWGPAWVSWRSGDDYFGWTPLPPRVNINISINIPFSRWVFVPRRYITSHRIYHYCVPRTRVRNIYHNTYIINNYYDRHNRRYVYGPRSYEIERATGSRVVVHRIDNSSRPGRPEVKNGSVRIYRPDIDRNERNTGRPARIDDYRNVRRNTSTENNNESRSERIESRQEERARPTRPETNTRNNDDFTRSAPRNEPARQPERERIQRSEPPAGSSQTQRPQRDNRPAPEARRSEQPQKRESSERSGGRPQRG